MRHKTSAWASGGPAGEICVAARIGRWSALPQHGAMTRIAPSRPTTPHSTDTFFSVLFVFSVEIRNKEETVTQSDRQAIKTKNYTFSLAAKSAEAPCSVATFIVNSEPHTGTRPSVRLCVGSITLNVNMNTARKLGPHAQTGRGTCPGMGL